MKRKDRGKKQCIIKCVVSVTASPDKIIKKKKKREKEKRFVEILNY